MQILERDLTIYDLGVFILFLLSITAVIGTISSSGKFQNEGRGRYTSFMVWRRVLDFAKLEAIYFFLAMIAAFTGSVCSTLQPIYLGKALDSVSVTVGKGNYDVNDSIDELTSSFTFIVVLELLKGLSTFAHEKTCENLGDFVRQRVQASI